MWWNVAIFVASLVVSYIFRPKQKFDSPKPGKVEPKAIATAGAEIGVLFGSREVGEQNIAWWGDVKTKAIKKKGGKK